VIRGEIASSLDDVEGIRRKLQANAPVHLGIYNATKAGLTQASEVWRLEMAPLGVRVMTLLTSGVETKFLAKLPSLLPENSYYTCITDIIENQPEHIPFAISPETFAHDVVRKVEKGTTGKYWIGGGVGLARAALWCFPQWAIVSILWTCYVLGRLSLTDH
jgi:NAD(P)-dependent dehydrogenase (short-subunit alcohol dehydrogenase family)